jgi:uncharacterized protein (DUF362 family)
MNSTVFLRRVDSTAILPAVRELLEQCQWQDLVQTGSSVVIKPNLCTDRVEQIHTANTSSSVLRAVCELLVEKGARVTIVESDGARYRAEAAFENNGVYDLAKDLGISVINLSKDRLVEMSDPRLRGFGLPRTWLDADVFITLPVLKTHATTVFTGALKNQWGCIPRHDRMLLHRYLHDLIATLNKLRPVTIALMDGLVGMQGRGPINGYPINLNALLASRDPVALDATAMRLIGLEPTACQHLRAAHALGLGTLHSSEINVEGPFEAVRTSVEPAVSDWAITLLNLVARSHFLTRWFLLNDKVFYPVRSGVTLVRRYTRRTPRPIVRQTHG